MTNEDDAPDAGDTAQNVFAQIPLTRAASVRTPSRVRRLAIGSLVLLIVVGTAFAYLSRPTTAVDPDAPRIVVEVSGMHCPLQCGLRMASALESLPWVIHDSVTANPKTGIVTFAVTNIEAVDQMHVRQVIERAGFGVISVSRPGSASDGDARRSKTTAVCATGECREGQPARLSAAPPDH